MSKKILIIIIAAALIIAVSVGGYFFWNRKSKEDAGIKILETVGKAAESITENAAKGVLPSMQVDPLGNKPDINPIDKTNPYKNIKINPFK